MGYAGVAGLLWSLAMSQTLQIAMCIALGTFDGLLTISMTCLVVLSTLPSPAAVVQAVVAAVLSVVLLCLRDKLQQ